MISQEMPYCCGISILANFPFPSNSKKENKKHVKEVLLFLKKAEYELVYRKGSTASIMQANLNGRQMSLLRTVFEEAGWTIPESFFHAAHSSRIFVLTKALYPEGIETKAPAGYDKFLKNRNEEGGMNAERAAVEGPYPIPPVQQVLIQPADPRNQVSIPSAAWRRMLEIRG